MSALWNAVFNNAAFGLETLTDSILKMPYMPSQARGLGIFFNEGIATTSIDLEYDAIAMTLIPSQQRGGPPSQYRASKRTLRSLKVPHYPLNDSVKPQDIQNIRSFGESAMLKTVQEEVDRRLLGMAGSHDLVAEYQSIGAIKGVIYDADGTTVLYNLFTEYGIAQPSIDFTFADQSVDMKRKCKQIARTIRQKLGGFTYDHIHCYCGNEWFDAFSSHADVKDAYHLWEANGQLGQFLRDDNRKGFPFGGIFFENYEGAAVGSAGTIVPYVAGGVAHFFPVGVPRLFRTVYSPGDFMESVNMRGLPRYARGEAIRGGKGLEIFTESNPLAYCTRPETLVLGTSSTWPTGIDVGDNIQVGG